MSYSNINAEKFQELKEKNDHVVIDVRSKSELVEGYIEGSEMIDIFSPDFMDRISRLDKSKTYLLYCRSGNRSGSACGIMSNLGFSNLYNLEGGIMAWNRLEQIKL